MSPRDLRLARTRGLALTPTRVRSAAPTCAGRIVQIGSCALRPHAQLSTAFSRSNAVQAAVSGGGLAELIKTDGRRLAEFRDEGALDEDRHDAKI